MNNTFLLYSRLKFISAVLFTISIHFILWTMITQQEMRRISGKNHLRWTKGFSTEEDIIFQFSAYYDNRSAENVIRVIGATYSDEQIHCLMFHNSIIHETIAKVIHLTVFNPKYKTIYVTCPSETPSPPDLVSLVLFSDLKQFPREKLKEYAIPITPVIVKQRREELKLAVCYQPLHNHGLSSHLLNVHIQVMQLLGIDKFIFYYDEDILETGMLKLVNNYIGKGLVKPVLWKLFVDPKNVYDGIGSFGQYAQIADCVYRFMGDFDYIFNIDADEFPILEEYVSWKEYLSSMTEEEAKEISYIVVQNAYIRTSVFQNKSDKEILDVISSKNISVMKPCTGYIEKCIVQPSKITWAFVHQILERQYGTSFVIMSSSVGRMYHLKSSLNILKEECLIEDDSRTHVWESILSRIRQDFIEI